MRISDWSSDVCSSDLHQRITIQVHGKSRDDRVEGALSRRHLVRMAGLKREAGAAVLQRNSGIGNDDARPKPLVIGLNERHHHPVLIGRRQAYGAAGPRLALTGIASMIGIDQLRTLLQIGGIEKSLRRGPPPIAITSDARRVGKGVVRYVTIR